MVLLEATQSRRARSPRSRRRDREQPLSHALGHGSAQPARLGSRGLPLTACPPAMPTRLACLPAGRGGGPAAERRRVRSADRAALQGGRLHKRAASAGVHAGALWQLQAGAATRGAAPSCRQALSKRRQTARRRGSRTLPGAARGGGSLPRCFWSLLGAAYAAAALCLLIADALPAGVGRCVCAALIASRGAGQLTHSGPRPPFAAPAGGHQRRAAAAHAALRPHHQRAGRARGPGRWAGPAAGACAPCPALGDPSQLLRAPSPCACSPPPLPDSGRHAGAARPPSHAMHGPGLPNPPPPPPQPHPPPPPTRSRVRAAGRAAAAGRLPVQHAGGVPHSGGGEPWHSALPASPPCCRAPLALLLRPCARLALLKGCILVALPCRCRPSICCQPANS